MKIPNFSFSQNILLCLGLTSFQIYLIFSSNIIYIPVFITVLSSFAYGILEIKRGWILSLLQITLIIGSYWTFIYFGINATNPDMAYYASHIIIFPSFVLSFIGSIIRRS